MFCVCVKFQVVPFVKAVDLFEAKSCFQGVLFAPVNERLLVS